MDKEKHYRKERIEQLMYELQRELNIGVREGQIHEHLEFGFIIPHSREIEKGVVCVNIEMHPKPRHSVYPHENTGKLKLV